MPRFWYLLLLLVIPSITSAQSTAVDSSAQVEEVAPEFPGGLGELHKYLKKTTEYPREARKAGEQGKVYVEFMIMEDGRVAEVSIKRGVSALIDSEALRVVRGMPAWSPGMKNGKPVRVKYILPVTFRL